MTSTTAQAADDTVEAPSFPMARASGCPFDPPPALMSRQEEARLVRVRLADGSTPWLVTRHADQRALMGDPRVSSDPSNPGYPSGSPIPPGGSKISFILMDDPEHSRLRRMITSWFTTRRVARMRSAIQQLVDDKIDELLAGPKPVDLVEAFALPVPSLVICELLGVPYADHDFFQDNSKAIIKRGTPPEERTAAHQALTEYLSRLVGDKMEKPGDDLLSGLAERVREGELTRGEAAQMGVLLLIAGHETTANMIALGTLALLEHPEQLDALRSGDEALVASAVEELLRYLNITHNGRRRVALEDIEVGDVVVRAGEGLIMANDIGNRDPRVFEDGDHLDLSRQARRHLAFGFGVHQCLGQQLARLELQVVYGTLYRRIPTLALATDLDSVPFKHDGAVYGVYELPVTW
ncbi:cytochrome P450 [Streptomyces sp. NPDC059740]|uniref:cytochrome P450 n=1 Tax=Streptomyces sp. NPDC059740 TaxID=3346926 RepID=UPI003652D5E7